MWALHSRQLAECTISHIETLSSLSGQLFWQLMAWGGHKVSELAPSLPKFLFVVKYSVLKKKKRSQHCWGALYDPCILMHPCMIHMYDVSICMMYLCMYLMDKWTNTKTNSKSWCHSGKWFWYQLTKACLRRKKFCSCEFWNLEGNLEQQSQQNFYLQDTFSPSLRGLAMLPLPCTSNWVAKNC